MDRLMEAIEKKVLALEATMTSDFKKDLNMINIAMINKCKDFDFLLNIALYCKENKHREHATLRLVETGNTDYLLKLFQGLYTDRKKENKRLSYWNSRDLNSIIEKLTNQESLYWIVNNVKDYELKSQALTKITKQEYLYNLALKHESEAIRRDACAKIKNIKTLQKLYEETRSGVVRVFTLINFLKLTATQEQLDWLKTKYEETYGKLTAGLNNDILHYIYNNGKTKEHKWLLELYNKYVDSVEKEPARAEIDALTVYAVIKFQKDETFHKNLMEHYPNITDTMYREPVKHYPVLLMNNIF